MAINFYSNKKSEYKCLSNFSAHWFNLDGKSWPTCEHYFQAKKFLDLDYQEKIRKANTPRKAKILGRSRKLPIRKDWEEVKESIMLKALENKFRNHKVISEILVSTGDKELVEDSPFDYYWGCGKKRTGKNRLGILLMKLRTRFRNEIATK